MELSADSMISSSGSTLNSQLPNGRNSRQDSPQILIEDQNPRLTRGSSSSNETAFTSEAPTGNCIPPIPIANVEKRNFLVGKVEKPSMAYLDDFNRCLPEGILHLYVGTWNMQNCKVPENINDFLLPAGEKFLQEIYVVGVQESTPEQNDWAIKLQETLGTNHVLAHSVSHGLLHLSVFVRRDLMWYCSDFQDSKVSTRIVSRVKTKGAVAVCFQCFGTSLLFVCCHFCSGENKTSERISNYFQINEKLNLPPLYKGTHSDTTDRFDYVFWFGDLNFRISQPHEHMKSEVSDPSTYNIAEAMKCDQLNRHMQKGRVFVGFSEPPICFLPTYKFDPQSDEYDTSHKLRVPSYTDRILHKCKDPGSTINRRYQSVRTLRNSDHRPVFAVYEISIKPGTDKVCDRAGQYNRDVYLKAAKRRAQSSKPQRSNVCMII